MNSLTQYAFNAGKFAARVEDWNREAEALAREMDEWMKQTKWHNARRKLKIQFEAMNVTRCEICGGTFALSFAHRYKRRFILTDDELMTVALLCQQCHERIEHSGHENMYRRITEIIEQREGTAVSG